MLVTLSSYETVCFTASTVRRLIEIQGRGDQNIQYNGTDLLDCAASGCKVVGIGISVRK